MYIIDPEFIIPGEKKIRMMIVYNYRYNRDKLTQLLKTAQSISLTTNLWTSHSKHDYLDLTATWINQNFEIMNVLLEITYFLTSHTAIEIASTIKKIMQKWKIEDRVITMITDNGANILIFILLFKMEFILSSMGLTYFSSICNSLVKYKFILFFYM